MTKYECDRGHVTFHRDLGRFVPCGCGLPAEKVG